MAAMSAEQSLKHPSDKVRFVVIDAVQFIGLEAKGCRSRHADDFKVASEKRLVSLCGDQLL